ncbi:MAG: asparagine synthase (glutamine-hydrolyzing) [Thaumarchaeota archaeon]|nr:asparagine synthase (glutamine-hydrolyzing) [Nitrososphaerota archaeon]
MGCGICGYVGSSDKQVLMEMCASMKHRGPDSTGAFVDDGIGLGIDRLSIIDLVKGNQPIHNEDQSLWVVLNGEIYNYVELRAELEALGHRFYTDSDTETIVHSYEAWGVDCVRHLRGMFAFAIWNSKTQELCVARDRFGKKPLYYAICEGDFVFGSELKAILKFPSAATQSIDYVALDLFFYYMYVPSPLTIFKGIRKLPPGCYGVFSLKGGQFKITKYWDISFEPDGNLVDEDDVADLLYAKVEDAVKVRLRSDVPLGAFLSGGVDSSVVASLMCKASGKVKTVSIGFEEGGLSELKYSRMVADFLGTDHKEFVVEASASELLPELISHFDEPFADHSFIPTYYLSKVTRQEVTVALSGDGGDEMFLGYPFMTDPSQYGLYSKVPRGIRRPILKVIRGLPGDSRVRRMADHAYEKDYGGQSAFQRYAMRVTSMDTQGLTDLYSSDLRGKHSPGGSYEYVLKLIDDSGAKDPIDAIDYATMRSYLSEGILVKVDRMSMAVSLEARCPLLDQDLFDFVRRIPSGMKLKDGETKHIFKRMAVRKGLIPREIAYRKKQGFGAPLEAWMRKDWRDLTSSALDPVVSRGYTGLFDPSKVRQLLADPYVNSNRLFSLIVFLQWYKMYVEEEKVAAPIN